MSDYDFRRHQRDPDASNVRTLLLKLRSGELTRKQIELAARIGCEDSIELCRTTLRTPIRVVDWLHPNQGRRDIMADVFSLYQEWRAALVFYACALVAEYARPFDKINPRVCRTLEERINDYQLSILHWHTMSPSEQELRFGLAAWPPSNDPAFREPGGFNDLTEDQQELVRRFVQLHVIFNSVKVTETEATYDPRHIAQDINAGYNADLILGVAHFANQLLVKYALGEVFPINTFTLVD